MAPRTLPWLKEEIKERPAPARPKATTKRRREASPIPGLPELDLNTTGVSTPARRTLASRLDDIPSSPPPHAETLAAPEIIYMNEGFDADDGFIMVEDEFFSTAQLFTRHLHHEEYVRRKKLARARIEDAAAETTRGVDGITRQSGEVKVKIKSAEKSKAFRRELAGPVQSNDEPPDTHLSSLLYRDNTNSVDLGSFAKSKARTKAAAGIVREKKPLPAALSTAMDVDDDDEDNLDSPTSAIKPQITTSKPHVRSPFREEITSNFKMQIDTSRHTGLFARAEVSSPSKPTSPQHDTGRPTATVHLTNDVLIDHSQPKSDALDFLAKRRAAMERKKQNQG